MPESEKKEVGDPGTPGTVGFEVEVGGEKITVTPESFTNLHQQHAGMATKVESAAAALKVAERYEVSVPELLQSAEGSFATMANLVDQGIIDKEGNVLTKVPKKEPGDVIPTVKSEAVSKGIERKFGVIAKALEGIGGRMDNVERDQTRLFRGEVQKRIQKEHPNLSDEDVARVFAVARRDKGKDIWEHAEALSATKETSALDTKRAVAKELGIDYDEFQANKLKEQDPDHGSAMFLTKGKRISFSNRRKPGVKEKDTVSPLDATKGFLYPGS